MVTHFTANAQVAACQKTVQNQDAEEQCTGLLKIAQGVYFVIAALVLLIELCKSSLLLADFSAHVEF